MWRMRVLVCADQLGPLSPHQAATAVAAAFAEAGATCAAVGLGAAGGAFAAAWTALDPAAVVVALPVPAPVNPLDAQPDPLPATSSLPLGEAVAAALAARPRVRRVVVDLAWAEQTHDAGAGLLAGLGATAAAGSLTDGHPGLAAVAGVDLRPARARLDGAELIGVTDEDGLEADLLGLRGVSSLRAHRAGVDMERALAADAALERLVADVAPDAARTPGAGAAGGAGWAVLALGGRLTAGPALLAEQLGLAQTAAAADLVVVAVDELSAIGRGGGVATHVATLCEELGKPLVLLARTVGVGAREQRTFGIEEAHAVGDVSTEAELTAAAAPVARAWRW